MGEGPAQEQEKVEFKIVVEEVGDDQETLVDDDDDVSCLDEGITLKRKGTLRLVIRSRAFL
jgi:hypothetical protein